MTYIHTYQCLLFVHFSSSLIVLHYCTSSEHEVGEASFVMGKQCVDGLNAQNVSVKYSTVLVCIRKLYILHFSLAF